MTSAAPVAALGLGARSRLSVSASAALSGIRAIDRCSGCRFLPRM
ncbi:hypothetical protein [Microbacterium suwonense]|nr:hypothetical protein [Microbacterium suwonense]